MTALLLGAWIGGSVGFGIGALFVAAHRSRHESVIDGDRAENAAILLYRQRAEIWPSGGRRG